MVNCPNCGYVNSSGNRFCHACGKPLRPRKPQFKEGAGQEFSSPERHRVPPKKKGSLLWILLVLLAVSGSILYVSNSKSQKEFTLPGGMETPEGKPVLVIQKFHVSPAGDNDRNRGEALALAVGEKLYSSEEIHIPEDYENWLFFPRRDAGPGNHSPITHFLSGSMTQKSENIEIHAQLQDRQGRILLRSAFDVPDDAQLFDSADSIAHQVEDRLAFRRLGKNELSAREITTISWPAWLDYAEGKKLFLSGRWNESRWYFNESVLKDPEFALGYHALAETAGVCGYPELSWMMSQKALGWMDRVSHRRRLQFKAEAYLKSEKNIQEALETYQEILKIYPRDDRARYFSGILQNQVKHERNEKGKMTAPLVCTAQVLGTIPYSGWPKDLCPEILETKNIISPGSRLMGAVCGMVSGQMDLAMEHAAAGQAMDSAGIFDRIIGDIHWIQGDLNASRSRYGENLKDRQPIEQIWRGFRLGQLALSQGRFREAGENWAGVLKTAETHGLRSWAYRIHCRLARMEISRSRYKSALYYSRQAMHIADREDIRDYPRKGLFWQGLAQAGLKQWSDVGRTLTELERVCLLGPSPNNMRYYHYLNGMVKAAGNILESALEDFQRAAALIPEQGSPFDFSNDQAFFLNGLAEALDRTGRRQEAMDIYERIHDLTAGRFDYGDVWALSLYQQGRLYDGMERRNEAAEKYRKFLMLWDSADRETWETDEARRRLNELEGL